MLGLVRQQEPVSSSYIAEVLHRAGSEIAAYRAAVECVRERSLFGGAYHASGVSDSERPKYGALELVRWADGQAGWQARTKNGGTHAMRLHHAAFNVRITFPKPGEALHQSYWQTVRRDSDGRMIAAAMGRSEDRLVKRNGRWLIQWRKLTVFTD